MLLGRNFAGENLSLKYDLENAESDEAVATVNLFASLECEAAPETNEQAIRNAEIDYNAEAKQQLIQIIQTSRVCRVSRVQLHVGMPIWRR